MQLNKPVWGILMTTTLFKNHVLYTDYRKVTEICEPLAKINTLGFIFMRYFRSGYFIDLSNQLDWSDYFLNRYMQEKYSAASITNHMLITEGISLWSLNKDNIIWQEGANEFGFGNGVSIFIKKKHYTDIFCFYSKKEHYEMNEFYISNIQLLKKFSNYFLEKAQPIIRQGIKEPLPIPKIYRSQQFLKSPENQTQAAHDLLTIIDPAYQRILKSEKITQRESECIQQCAKGKSAQEAGKALCVSRRTVETHLNNAKLKLECANLSELIAIVMQYGLVTV